MSYPKPPGAARLWSRLPARDLLNGLLVGAALFALLTLSGLLNLAGGAP